MLLLVRDALQYDASNPLSSSASVGHGGPCLIALHRDGALASNLVRALLHQEAPHRAVQLLPISEVHCSRGVARYGHVPVRRRAVLARGPDCDDVDSSLPPLGAEWAPLGSLKRKVLLALTNVKSILKVICTANRPQLWSDAERPKNGNFAVYLTQTDTARARAQRHQSYGRHLQCADPFR